MSKFTVELIKRNSNKPTRFELEGKNIEPCPFCGSIDIYVVENDKDYQMCWCGCAMCGAEGPCRPNRHNAIRVWQDRN